MTPQTLRQMITANRAPLLFGLGLGLVWGTLAYWVFHMHWFPMVISAALMGAAIAFWYLHPRPYRR